MSNNDIFKWSDIITIKRVKLSNAIKKKGKSKKTVLDNMTEEEIHRRVMADPDNPPLTDEQLEEFSHPTNKLKDDENNS